MKLKSIGLIALMAIGWVKMSAEPPAPALGYRWVIQAQFSDEFNTDELDRTKWKDSFGGWQGRPPAKFVPEAVSVNDGNLQIKNGVMDNPDDRFWISGGAVSSVTYGAHFGYYECRSLASKIAMSTTFWMSNDKVPFTESGDCDNDKFSQELDIQEGVGGATKILSFKDHMNSNTHYRYIYCNEKKETFISKGANTKLSSPIYADYHIYGAWWKDAEEVLFYADDEFFEQVRFSKKISQKPFARPMKINMVTETYDWQTPPSKEDLLNDKINTSYYDWVRSYRLIPFDSVITDNEYDAKLYEEDVLVSEVKGIVGNDEAVSFVYTYKAIQDRVIEVSIIEGKWKAVQKVTFNAYKGYGKASYSLPFDFEYKKGEAYKIEVLLKESAESKEAIDDVAYDLNL